MSLSMYQASVPVFQRTLGALDKILDKAAAYASERKIDPATLLGAGTQSGQATQAAAVERAAYTKLDAALLALQTAITDALIHTADQARAAARGVLYA